MVWEAFTFLETLRRDGPQCRRSLLWGLTVVQALSPPLLLDRDRPLDA